jgi:hypothetical protein
MVLNPDPAFHSYTDPDPAFKNNANLDLKPWEIQLKLPQKCQFFDYLIKAFSHPADIDSENEVEEEAYFARITSEFNIYQTLRKVTDLNFHNFKPLPFTSMYCKFKTDHRGGKEGRTVQYC